MGFVLGFGITEQREQVAIKSALHEGLKAGETIKQVLDRWNVKADKYDKQPRGIAPERYTRVFFYDDALHFHHVNREHGLSPDGWGQLVVEEPFRAQTGGE